jgi:DNA-binding NarL/FixJ family response regulator
MTTTLLLADDHILVRDGLALLIAEHADWEVVALAESGEEAVEQAKQLQPRVAVLDVEMPGMNGIEAAKRIRMVSPGTAVIALSTYGDIQYRERMFEAGAAGDVLKNEAMAELVDAVDAALCGARYVSPSIRKASDTAGQRSVALDQESLSERELEVLRLLAEGRRTKEIAELLGISARTVETYRGRIMLKLDIHTLPGLVKFALRAGMTEPAC